MVKNIMHTHGGKRRPGGTGVFEHLSDHGINALHLASNQVGQFRITILFDTAIPHLKRYSKGRSLSGRKVTPDFPGLAGVDNCRDWKPGIPIS